MFHVAQKHANFEISNKIVAHLLLSMFFSVLQMGLWVRVVLVCSRLIGNKMCIQQYKKLYSARTHFTLQKT